MSSLTIREAEPRGDELRAIYELLKRMWDEAPMEQLNPMRACVEIERVVTNEGAWVVFDGETLVATMGLVQADLWFTDSLILVTRWLYALPAYRGDTSAWGLMLTAAREIAKDTGYPAWLDVHNPLKPRHAGRLQQGFARFSFDPRGSRLSVSPA